MTRRFIPSLRSFRVRIALLSTVLSAAVLLAFAVLTYQSVERMNMRRIDQSIRELGERPLHVRQVSRHWDFVVESLEFVLGDLKDNAFIMLVKGRDGAVLHISDNWPLELAANAFPTPIDAGFDEGPPAWGPGPDDRDRPRPPWRDSPRGQPGPPDFPRGPQGPPPRPMPIKAGDFFMAHAGGNQWRIGIISNPEVTFVLGLNMAPYMAEMNRLRRLYLLAVPVSLLLVAATGWWLAQRALRPVKALTRAAETITARGLDQRIPSGQEDIEFDRLICVFNDMLDRLEKSFHQAVRFSADAAHELKTPLTILQGELENGVQSAVSGSEQQQMLAHLLEEVQRLKTISRKLLLLALADSGQLKPQYEPLNMSEAIEAVGEDVQIQAPELKVETQVEPNLWIQADADMVRQIVHNLTGNAIKYNVPGGLVRLVLSRQDENVRFSVGNSGPGIPPADRERVFDRFYRSDKSRNRRVDGVGLGLSLAREMLRAHHSELELEQRGDGLTTFAFSVPAIRPPASM